MKHTLSLLFSRHFEIGFRNLGFDRFPFFNVKIEFNTLLLVTVFADLDFTFMGQTFQGTALSPSERFKRIDWFHEGMRIATEDEFLENFGVTFPLVNENQVPESVLVPGRILLPPTIQLRVCFQCVSIYFAGGKHILDLSTCPLACSIQPTNQSEQI